MVNHVVLFKLNDYPLDEKKKILQELKEILENLKKEIKEIVFLEVGINHEVQAKSFDISLLSHFKSFEDLDTYRVHPAHLKVVERIKETTQARAAVDYEF